jgi:mono/diheme cytochrome c family protein
METAADTPAATPAEPEPEEEAPEPEEKAHPGEKVFADNCSNCHDVTSTEPMKGLAGVGGKYDDAGFREKLDGHMGTSVTGKALDDLVAYLLTLT